MKIDQFVLLKLAEMICGDAPFNSFPYRSSLYLTKFFNDLDFDYEHDGTTRRSWVNDVLKELNAKQQLSPEMPSRELVVIIENLLHSNHFLGKENVDREKSIETVITYLKSNNLTIVRQLNDLVKVCPLQDASTEKLVPFKPSVFKRPDKPPNDKLISVMMPFDAGFDDTYSAIQKVAEHMSLKCSRADGIGENSTLMQGIFDLIFLAKIIVVDFTGCNPNVLYETGIAHTLGKIVIPITQSLDDIPSDLGHHRALKYLPNEQGYRDLSNELYKKIKIIYETGNLNEK